MLSCAPAAQRVCVVCAPLCTCCLARYRLQASPAMRFECGGRWHDCAAGWLQAVKITPQTDFSRLKVGQLKELLRDRGVSCRDCFEKADFISKLRELAAAQT